MTVVNRSGAEDSSVGGAAHEPPKLPEGWDRLEDLVPEFLPKVPLAKYTVSQNEFQYFSSEGSHHLSYMAIPPFGRRIYEFETGKWRFLD